MNRLTVGRWRRRFLAKGWRACSMSRVPGRRARSPTPTSSGSSRLTLETTPRDATHWSTRSMAQPCGLSQTAISRIWRAFALQPHRVETFKLSKDPLFIEKVRDIVGLYLHPPDQALVLVRRREDPDPGPGSQSQPCCPCGPGQPERQHARLHAPWHDHAVCRPRRRRRARSSARVHQRHRAREFRQFLDTIDAPRAGRPRRAPDPGQLQHAQDAGDSSLARATPPLPSALHPDQRLLAQPRRALVRRLTEKQLRAGSHRSTRELRRAIRRYLDAHQRGTPSPSSGPRPPTRSSRASLDFVSGSLTRDTSERATPSSRR